MCDSCWMGGAAAHPVLTGPEHLDEALPSGDVTFVFTDIEGSTRLLKRLGERARNVFERHDELLRSVWRTHGGHEVSTEGDAFFVAFDDAGQAMRACVEAQRRIATEPWPEDGAVRIRIGLHTGFAVARNGDYLALAVHQAARVAAAPHGGQILVSAATARRAPPPAGSHLVRLGRFRLRDFDEPVTLFRLDPDGLDPVTTAIRAIPAEGHNLVHPPTAFIDRDDDLGALVHLLRPGAVVTLVGPGGVGKTRLVVEAGLSIAGDWPDGVWLVELDEVADARLVVDAVAATLGAPASETGSREDDLVAYLAERELLLILDTAERHVQECSRLVATLNARCRRLAVLATSREPLSIAGETVQRLHPLAMPERVTGRDPEAVMEQPAVQLFCDRARLADRTFRADAAIEAVADICMRLDGLPLALEIAAARVGVMSVEEIRSGLRDRFLLLRSRDRTRPERHRTMTHLLDWSYRLLDDAERAVLRRSAVFGGSFHLETASLVLAGDDLESDDVPELVWSLVDKSLLLADPVGSGTRYRLPESVRAYALQKLHEDPTEAHDVGRRLADRLLERIGPWHQVDRTWLHLAASELANLRALVPFLADVEAERAQQLACSIARYHDAVQSFATGIAELSSTVEQLPTPTSTRVVMLTALADLHLRRADLAAAVELRDAAAAVQREHGPAAWDDVALDRTSGEIAIRSGDDAHAIEIAEAALGRSPSTRGQARMWNLLGIARHGRGDAVGAAEAFRRELDAYLELGFESKIATAHANVAEAALALGRRVEAAEHQRACLDLAVVLGQPVMMAYSFIVASRLAALRHEWELAVRLQGSAGRILDDTGHALYTTDQRTLDEVRSAARAALGDAPFDAADAAGRRLDVLEATELATDLFDRITDESNDDGGT